MEKARLHRAKKRPTVWNSSTLIAPELVMKSRYQMKKMKEKTIAMMDIAFMMGFGIW